MITSDDQNLLLATSTEAVDKLNAQFYGKFPYPWRPLKIDQLFDPDWETIMLNQDLGDWQHGTLPKNPKIWVAGCGTNQAVFTALKFPNATVLGSDLSTQSLEICSGIAEELGIANVEFKQESLNHVSYQQEFDYVISTGVIHHNAKPEKTLARLAAALKPQGIMELMVYNRYHRIFTSNLQKAVRMLSSTNASSVDFESELEIALQLVNGGFATQSMSMNLLQEYRRGSESKLADTLIQPVEQSYTVESLAALTESCGLEIVAPKINLFDLANNTYLWNTEFSDPDLQEKYEELPDLKRWQISNLLHLEKSPMLWFYLQHQTCERPIKSELQICKEFLDTKFVKTETRQKSYILGRDGKYKEPRESPFPKPSSDPLTAQILQDNTPAKSMREIFQNLEIDTDFQTVNKVRLQLTTSAFPYLQAN